MIGRKLRLSAGALLLAALACGLPGQVSEPTPSSPEPTQPPVSAPTSSPTGMPVPDTLGDLARIDPSSAHRMNRIATLELPASEAVFDPDMAWVALAMGSGLQIYELPSLQPSALYASEEEGSFPYAFSGDGSTLIWRVRPGAFMLAELPNGSRRELSLGLDPNLQALRLSADGSLLAANRDGSAQVWRIDTGERLLSVEHAYELNLSPDGGTLAVASTEELKVSLWDVAEGRYLRDLSGFSTAAPVYGTFFSPDWETMVWVARASMQFTHVPSGTIGPELIGSWGEFSPDGEILAVVEDGWYGDTYLGQVRLYSAPQGEQVGVLEHTERVRALAYSPEGTVLAVATPEAVHLWDASTRNKLPILLQPERGVDRLTFSPDGRLLATSSFEGGVEFWGIPLSGTSERTITRLNAEFVQELGPWFVEGATDVAFRPESTSLATATERGQIEIWDWESRAALTSFKAHDSWIYRARYSPDGSRLASASLDGSVGIWEAGTGAPLFSFNPEAGEAAGVAFAPDGSRLLSAHQDGSIYLWDLSTRTQADRYEGHTDWVWGVTIADDGSVAASSSADGTARMWDLTTGEEDYTLRGHESTIWDVAISPDGSLVATSSWDGSILLWDRNSGSPVTALRGHTDWVYGIAFAPVEPLLASASKDGTVRIWDTISGELLQTLEGHEDLVWSVAFSPDGSVIASASSDGTVRLWAYAP